jgi:hypothetical protein
MTRLLTQALAIAIFLGTTAMLTISNQSVKPPASAEAALAADGAFRDGLYLGKLAAERGQPQRAAIGRWFTEHDRSMFTAGYFRGYKQSVAEANTASAARIE